MELLELFIYDYRFATIGFFFAVIFSLICSVSVKTTFAKYNRISTSANTPACDVARQILDANGLYSVQVVRVSGNLTDHYDPRNNIIALSDTVYGSSAIGAIGVAAHECGHAVQYAQSYLPIKIRNLIYPAVSFCSHTWFWVLMIGFAFNMLALAEIGVIFFAFMFLFQVITLPVEFNASRRAVSTLSSMGILYGNELSGAKRVLRAAAMTYVASALVSLMQLLRLIASTQRRR